MAGFRDFIADTMPAFLGGMSKTPRPGALDKVNQNLTAAFNVMKILDPFIQHERNVPTAVGTPDFMPPEFDEPQIDKYSHLNNTDEDLITYLLNVTRDKEAARNWFPVSKAFREFLFRFVLVMEKFGKLQSFGESSERVPTHHDELVSRIDHINTIKKVKRYVPMLKGILDEIRNDRNIRYLEFRKQLDNMFAAFDVFYNAYNQRSPAFFEYIETRKNKYAHLKWDQTPALEPRGPSDPDKDAFPYAFQDLPTPGGVGLGARSSVKSRGGETPQV